MTTVGNAASSGDSLQVVQQTLERGLSFFLISVFTEKIQLQITL